MTAKDYHLLPVTPDLPPSLNLTIDHPSSLNPTKDRQSSFTEQKVCPGQWQVSTPFERPIATDTQYHERISKGYLQMPQESDTMSNNSKSGGLATALPPPAENSKRGKVSSPNATDIFEHQPTIPIWHVTPSRNHQRHNKQPFCPTKHTIINIMTSLKIACNQKK